MATGDSPIMVNEQAAFWERYRHLGTIRRYLKGAMIYQQGECSDKFYCLVSGRVKIYLDNPDGSQKLLAIADPGLVFGDSACFDQLPYYASAMALRTSEVCIFERSTMLAAMAHDPTLVAEMLRCLVRKQRQLAVQVESMAFFKVPARVAHVLVRLAEDHGQPLPDGQGKRITYRLTHEEIASFLGTSRVTVSREISQLIRLGILARDKWSLIVLDEARLRQRTSQV